MGWVLVVDDEAVAAESLVLQLKSRRIRALRAQSADEALAVLRSAPLAPVAIVLEPLVGEASATRLLDAIEADPVLKHARPLILTRAQNPIVMGRAAMIFRKATDSDRLLMVVEALARNHGVQGLPNQVVSAAPEAHAANAARNTVVIGKLKMEFDNSTGVVTEVRLFGRSDAREPADVLRAPFERALAEAAEHQRGLRVHFEQLEYFNSSTLAFLIQLIHQARERRVSMEVSFDGEKNWQSVSFDALKRAMKMFERGEAPPVTFVSLGSPPAPLPAS